MLPQEPGRSLLWAEKWEFQHSWQLFKTLLPSQLLTGHFLGFSAEFVILAFTWSHHSIQDTLESIYNLTSNKNRKKEKEKKFLSNPFIYKLGTTKLEYMVTAKVLNCDSLDDLISVLACVLLYATLLWEAHIHALGCGFMHFLNVSVWMGQSLVLPICLSYHIPW